MEQYNVTGMTCAACQARVEKVVSKVPGVTSVSVSLLTNSMGVEGTALSTDIVAAVENAFKSFSTISKFPFFVLFVDLPPEDIDVNIHPTKAEIKFKDERIVYKRVFDTVHHALKEDIFNSFAETKKSEPTETIEEIKLDLDNNYINGKIDEQIQQK